MKPAAKLDKSRIQGFGSGGAKAQEESAFWGTMENVLGSGTAGALSSAFSTIGQEMSEMANDIEAFVNDAAGDISDFGAQVGAVTGIACGAPTKAQLASSEISMDRPMAAPAASAMDSAAGPRKQKSSTKSSKLKELQLGSKAGPEDEPERPGFYIVIHEGTRVGASFQLASKGETIASLKAGTIVEVAEVSELVEEKRMRGRLVSPAGWISLRNTQSGQRWAIRQTSGEEGAKSKSAAGDRASSSNAMVPGSSETKVSEVSQNEDEANPKTDAEVASSSKVAAVTVLPDLMDLRGEEVFNIIESTPPISEKPGAMGTYEIADPFGPNGSELLGLDDPLWSQSAVGGLTGLAGMASTPADEPLITIS